LYLQVFYRILDEHNSNERERMISVACGLILADGSVFRYDRQIVYCDLLPNETKEFQLILTPSKNAIACFLNIDCSENIQWTIEPE